MKILVDLSFINSENKIRESVAIYALRVLDGFNEEALKSISILVSDDYKEFFINKYPNLKLEVYPSLKSAIYKIPYMKGVFKMLLWKKIVNYLNYDVVYIPFAWSGNSLAVKSKKIITIHDLKPMRVASRMFSNTFVFKMLKLSFIYLYVSRYFFSCHIKNATKVIAISDYVNNDISKEWPRNIFDFATFMGEFIKDDKGNSLSLVNSLKLFSLKPVGMSHDPLNDALDLKNLFFAFINNTELVKQEYIKQLAKNHKMPDPVKEVMKLVLNKQSVTYDIFEQIVDDYLK